MSLRKSPTRTPALLAACRANAQKSTGPRTPQGKARSRLNSLRHGAYCRTLHRRLPEGLSFSNRLLFNWIHGALDHTFRPQTAQGRDEMQHLALQVWCQAAGALGVQAERSGNVTENSVVREEGRPRIHYRITRRNPKESLTFWTQADGRKPRLRAGERRGRAQGLFALWYGYGPVKDWAGEPLPDPERDPMGFWHWQRFCKRRGRAARRARAREARQAQTQANTQALKPSRSRAWDAFMAELRDVARASCPLSGKAVPAAGASPGSLGRRRLLAFPDVIGQSASTTLSGSNSDAEACATSGRGATIACNRGASPDLHHFGSPDPPSDPFRPVGLGPLHLTGQEGDV